MKAALVIRHRLEPGTRVPVTADSLLLGRNEDNAVVLESPRVSRYHARISLIDAVYRIEDLGSRNGTWLNGARIAEAAALKDSDVIHIGDVTLVFEVQGKETMTMVDGRMGVPDGLTQREAQILGHVAAGRSNSDIANILVLSVRTVERHVTNIYRKIGARNRSEATAYALSQGIC